MKCLICGKEFVPKNKGAVAICDECSETREELTNGKEEE